jgi:hypothetical protein
VTRNPLSAFRHPLLQTANWSLGTRAQARVPNPAAGSAFSPDTQEIRNCPDFSLRGCQPLTVSRKPMCPAMESEPSALTDTAKMVSVPDNPPPPGNR